MEGTLSPADVAVLSGNNRGNDGMFDGNGAWWIVLFLIFGWGRNGFGGNGGSGAYDNYVLASDFATIQRQLSDGFSGVEKGIDTIRNGLCDGFYTEAQLFNGVNTNILTSSNAIQSQLAECCCATQRAIDGVNYNMATNTCAITTAINSSARDIIDSQNANYRALYDEIVANKIEAKNEKIAEQNQEINALRLKASQEAQNAYLLNELKPCPSAAYIVPNPNCCYNYQVTPSCGCGNY